MELVKILRELWRRKALVGVVFFVALVVGLLLAFKPGLPPHSRQYDVSLSSADILVDTSDSQVAAVNGHGPDLPTLAGRANLIGNLMTGGPLKEAIASDAGIAADHLVVVPPGNPAAPNVPAVPVRPAASRGIPDSDSTILTLTTDETLPILHIVAQAPDAEAARELTTAAVAEIKRYVGGVVAAQNVAADHQLVIRELGAPVGETATRGVPRSYALIAFFAILALGCGAILGGGWFVRSWRQVEAEENAGKPPTNGNGRGPSGGDGSKGTQAGSADLAHSSLVRFPL
jgi:hypothetical protein